VSFACEFDYSRGRTDVVALRDGEHVIAFEAKLKDWRTALHQAYRNTCFAHHCQRRGRQSDEAHQSNRDLAEPRRVVTVLAEPLLAVDALFQPGEISQGSGRRQICFV
jgi:hypothetical protein